MKITTTQFRGVLQRLGVVPFPRDGFELADTVLPVSLVDSDITLQSIASPPLLDTPSTAGELVAPAAGTRLANTGAQAAGNYLAVITIDTAEGVAFRIRRRNAADTADIWVLRCNTATGMLFLTFTLRVVLALNEFLVVENVVAGTAGITYQSNIWLTAS